MTTFNKGSSKGPELCDKPGNTPKPNDDEKAPLPDGWARMFSRTKQRHYYVNVATRKSQWQHPNAQEIQSAQSTCTDASASETPKKKKKKKKNKSQRRKAANATIDSTVESLKDTSLIKQHHISPNISSDRSNFTVTKSAAVKRSLSQEDVSSKKAKHDHSTSDKELKTHPINCKQENVQQRPKIKAKRRSSFEKNVVSPLGMDTSKDLQLIKTPPENIPQPQVPKRHPEQTANQRPTSTLTSHNRPIFIPPGIDTKKHPSTERDLGARSGSLSWKILPKTPGSQATNRSSSTPQPQSIQQAPAMDQDEEAMETESYTEQILAIRSSISVDSLTKEATGNLTQKLLETSSPEHKKSTSSKLYVVIDSNILIQHLPFIRDLRDLKIPEIGGPAVLVIPWMVLQELDAIKQNRRNMLQNPKLQSQARHAINYLNQCIESGHPQLQAESIYQQKIPIDALEIKCNDDWLIHCCFVWKQEHPEAKVLLLSHDTNLRSKTIVNGVDAMGVQAFHKRYITDGTGSKSSTPQPSQSYGEPSPLPRPSSVVPSPRPSTPLAKPPLMPTPPLLPTPPHFSVLPTHSSRPSTPTYRPKPSSRPSTPTARPTPCSTPPFNQAQRTPQNKNAPSHLSKPGGSVNRTPSSAFHPKPSPVTPTSTIIARSAASTPNLPGTARTPRTLNMNQSQAAAQSPVTPQQSKTTMLHSPDAEMTSPVEEKPRSVAPVPNKTPKPTAVVDTHARDMTRICGEILVDMETALCDLLGGVLKEQLIKVFGEHLWHSIVYRKPPWTCRDVLESMNKHWIAVFGMVMSRDAQSHLQSLLAACKRCEECVGVPDTENLLTCSLSFCKYLPYSKSLDTKKTSTMEKVSTYQRILKGLQAKTLKATSLTELMKQSQNIPPSSPQVKTSQPSQTSTNQPSPRILNNQPMSNQRPRTPNNQSRPRTPNNQPMSSQQSTARDSPSPHPPAMSSKPASNQGTIMIDDDPMTSPPPPPPPIPQPNIEEKVMLAFQLLWDTILIHRNGIAQKLSNGEAESKNYLRQFCVILALLYHHYKSLLSVEPASLGQHVEKVVATVTTLDSCAHEFVIKDWRGVTVDELGTFYQHPGKKELLDNGLEQLVEIMKSLIECQQQYLTHDEIQQLQVDCDQVVQNSLANI